MNHRPMKSRRPKAIRSVFLSVGAVAVAIPLFLQGIQAPPSLPPGPRSLDRTPSLDLEPVRTELPAPHLEVTLERGDTVAGKLREAGLSEHEAPKVLQSLSSVVDLRKVRAGTQVVVSFAADGLLHYLDLTHRGEPVGRVERADREYVARIVELPTDVRVVAVAGELQSSLWNTFEDMGERPDLAIKMSKLFAWQVDFARDLDRGDRFSLVVEKLERDGRLVGYGQILGATLDNRGKQFSAIHFETSEGPAYFNAAGESQKRAFLKSPVAFTRISSRFTHRRFHPVLKVNRPHWGVDYAAPRGTPVMAAGSGKVTLAGWNGGLGRTVAIAHGRDIVTKYGHLHKIASGIRPGVRVDQGQVIGYVGSTGLSTGPHLDFRFQRRGKYVDPLQVLAEQEPIKLDPAEMPAFMSVRDRVMIELRGAIPGSERVVELRRGEAPNRG